MILAVACVAFMVLMAVVPSREQLAREVAEENDRCGDVVMEAICLKAKGHADEHVYESTKTTIPFE